MTIMCSFGNGSNLWQSQANSKKTEKTLIELHEVKHFQQCPLLEGTGDLLDFYYKNMVTVMVLCGQMAAP